VPAGCPFHPRCRYAQPSCATDRPEPRLIADTHLLACPPDPLRAAPAAEGGQDSPAADGGQDGRAAP